MVMTTRKDSLQLSSMSIMILTSELACFVNQAIKQYIHARCMIADHRMHVLQAQNMSLMKEYNSLPAQDKPNWFVINDLLSTAVQGKFPELNAQQINTTLHNHLLGNYVAHLQHAQRIYKACSQLTRVVLITHQRIWTTIKDISSFFHYVNW